MSVQMVDSQKVQELAKMASTLNPQQVLEYNAKMELELAQRMKNMTPQEIQKLQAVKDFVTDQTVQVLQPQTVQGISFDPETQRDQDLLAALRTQPVQVFIALFNSQQRTKTSDVRFHSDNEGHPLLHWAAMDDKLDVIVFLCNVVKVDVNMQNVKGETALHWACVKGNTRSVHLLLSQFGANIHLVDSKGYSLLHVAAQNGHVLTLAQLNRKGMLNIDVRDNHGRTPLLWASYRGFGPVVRWLLSHGADPDAEDHERCCALHWAAIRSHTGVIQTLCMLGDSGSKLFVPDKTGKTPKELAQAKMDQAKETGDKWMTTSFQNAVKQCQLQEEMQLLVQNNNGKPTLRMRLSGKLPHFSYWLWPVLAPIGFHQYLTVLLPSTSQFMFLHLLFVLSFFFKWFFWIRLQFKDPGEFVIPVGPPGTILGFGSIAPTWGWRRNGWPDFTRRIRNRDSQLEATVPNVGLKGAEKHRELYHRVLDEGLLVPVCLTCEIVKPARSKHDAISNTCVAKFDHFCPWMNACIGQNNYFDFFMTAFCATAAMWIWVFFVYVYTRDYSLLGFVDNVKMIGIKWELFAWFYLILALYATAMLAQHIQLASKNMSTNEMISGSRYRYLVEDGKRGNPFHRGILANFMELFGLTDELPMLDPEEYHAKAFVFGNFPEPVPEPVSGSPWYRKSHGHQHGGDEEGGECHGHSH